MDLTDRQRVFWIAAILSAATLALFWPVTSHEFISYDDRIYITDNLHVSGGLTWDGIAWAFRTGHGGNWHPLTWISHMLDVQCFGLRPGWHHLVSAVLHAANAALLFLLLRRLTGATWRSAFVAALFAWHPLHVESVAWAAERKDVLSTFFGLLSLIFYASFAGKSQHHNPPATVRCAESTFQGPERESGTSEPALETPEPRLRMPAAYGLSLLCFALALMAKPMVVTLPFLMLLLDYWPLRRGAADRAGAGAASGRGWSSLVLEKLPFFALAIGSCITTLLAQSRGGAVVSTRAFTLVERLANAVVTCALYLWKTFWPVDLALLYPLRAHVPAVDIVISAIVILVTTGWAVSSSRSRPWLAVGWFWFLGMLVPVIGLVQVGMQQRADRYTYLPVVGVFIMIAWEIAERFGTWRSAPRAFAAVAVAVLLVCCILTNRQLAYWADSETLFAHTIAVTGDNYVALHNHGLALREKGHLDEAVLDFQKAIALAPELDAARVGLGEVLAQQGKLDEAVEQFTKVLALQPDHADARRQLGVALGRQGKLEEASEALAAVLSRQPEDVAAHNNLGNVLTLQGRLEDAAAQFAEAVRLQPKHAAAHNNLAIACKKLGRTAEAIGHYREAIRLKPDSLEALNNLAWVLAADPAAEFRNGAEAVELATRATELTRYQHPTTLATLAAAYAEIGQFNEAVSFGERAKELARGQGPLGERLDEMLGAFRAGKPYRAE